MKRDESGVLPHRRWDQRGGSFLDKAEALRRAQLEVVDLGGRTAHPYFWAPFVLLGESMGERA